MGKEGVHATNNLSEWDNEWIGRKWYTGHSVTWTSGIMIRWRRSGGQTPVNLRDWDNEQMVQKGNEGL